ncbi:MAG: hypothetical protein COB20_12420 [SAR86 cluster bacterium]|uniref:DUF1631 family protein n=1 Tax=SAR86 cluster bacterium TaxID=2030880 RepID=A0A2A4X0S5_9GAMM|nr:MAG: hypothetical protein COB20_12420 [SAR86 cluster bacterium]
MDNGKKILNTVRDAMAVGLSELVSEALSDANMKIVNEPAGRRSRNLNLMNERSAVLERFAVNMRAHFDELTGVVEKEVNVLGYGSLSLVEEEDLEAIIAMEGMISHARNCDISEYLSFTTRFDTLFYGMRIDESNNPMDPEQIGEAFKEAVRPLGMTATELLITYRKFNSGVFHNLEKALTEANNILVDNKVLPDLDMAARSRTEQQNKRSSRPQKINPTDRAFATAGAAAGGQQLLSVMQKLEPQNLSKSVGKLLEQESSADTLRAIDSESSDIVNLVTFLYEEIWNDKTVPIPVKELSRQNSNNNIENSLN